ncbi:SDR family oxidoreductase [Patescibacteria group bacterium]|nr:SDR family oxidoreductase [Patescibacteria group bacterium]
MLGRKVVEILLDSPRYTVYGVEKHKQEVSSPAFTVYGDLTDPAFITSLLTESKPAVIIHCAAITDVDLCERDHGLARTLHVDTTKQLASYAPAKFMYISTDSVFDGQSGGYTESDTPAPQNYYALTKLEGEQAALSANPQTTVLRTNIYGFHYPLGRSLAEWAVSSLKAGEKIHGFTDVFFNPLYTKQLARIISFFSESNFHGIIHAASSQNISKYDFIRSIATKLQLSLDLLQPGRLRKENMSARRPTNSTLNINMMKGLYPNLNDLSLEAGIQEFCIDYRSTPKSKL